MFEHRTQPLLSRPEFLARLARSGAVAVILIVASLTVGMLGYHVTEHLGWLDAFLNSAMLLGGMGPVNTPTSVAGKLFAGVYALYCGLAVIMIAGLLLTPVAHRMLHKFHLEGRKRTNS
jgi:hypothetical protein